MEEYPVLFKSSQTHDLTDSSRRKTRASSSGSAQVLLLDPRGGEVIGENSAERRFGNTCSIFLVTWVPAQRPANTSV